MDELKIKQQNKIIKRRSPRRTKLMKTRYSTFNNLQRRLALVENKLYDYEEPYMFYGFDR